MKSRKTTVDVVLDRSIRKEIVKDAITKIMISMC